MSMLRNLFGKASEVPKATPKDAIVRLRENLEMLDKREKYLLQKIDQELVVAKQNAAKNKRGNTSLACICPEWKGLYVRIGVF